MSIYAAWPVAVAKSLNRDHIDTKYVFLMCK